MTFKPDFLPKNSLDKLQLINEISSVSRELKKIDIDSMVDRDVEDRRFTDSIQSEVTNTASNIEEKASSLESIMVLDVQEDFADNLKLYNFMVQNKLEEDYFPFYEWLKYMDEVEKQNSVKLKPNHQIIFETIESIAEVDESLAKGNLSYYLDKVTDKIKKNDYFFQDLEKLVSKIFPNASLIDALCGKETYEIHRGLVGNHIPLTDKSKLIYSYAVTIPNTSWQFKTQESGDFKISFSSIDYEEIYAEFSKSEIWSRIKDNPEYRKNFVKEIFNADIKENPFYETDKKYTWTKLIKEVKWNNIKAFVTHLSKDDVELAEFITNKILSMLTSDKKELHSAEAMQVVNLALKAELQNDLPVMEIKEKKMKI